MNVYAVYWVKPVTVIGLVVPVAERSPLLVEAVTV
jgi:hypothetical protein